jgi:hypothetical protein
VAHRRVDSVSKSELNDVMPVGENSLQVKVTVNKDRYELYKEAAKKDLRSFSQWAMIALEEKLIRDSKTPRP